MLLRSKVKAVRPKDDGSCKREFLLKTRTTIKRKVFDDNGDFIREIDDDLIEARPVPIEEKLHLSQTCDMFLPSVLSEAGVQTQLITSFDRSSLDEQSVVVSQLDSLTEEDFK